MFKNAVVKVKSQLYGVMASDASKPNAFFSCGAGFAINETQILTAFHILVNVNTKQICHSTTVIQDDDVGLKPMTNANLIIFDQQLDLALLELPSGILTKGGLKIRKCPALLGETTGCFGYPGAMVASISGSLTSVFTSIFKSGSVSRLDLDSIFFDVPLFPGFSGGPYFDVGGNVVGIDQQINTLNINLPFDLSSGKNCYAIMSFLNANSIKYSVG